MKKLLFTVAGIISLQVGYSQTTTVHANDTTAVTLQQSTPTPKKKDWKKIDLSNRPNDHFMFQYGKEGWSGTVPDSAKPKGFSRFFNAYVMLDKPFKTNPRLSVGLGVGVGSDDIFFNGKQVNVAALSTTLPFAKLDSSNHFKKFKLAAIFAEVPVELRYTADPENSSKSFKVAVGAKVGYLINAHTKGKTLVDKNGNTLNSYIQKESSEKYFNTTRLALTARVGYGILSLFGSYQITSFIKDGLGPSVQPYSIGINISGL